MSPEDAPLASNSRSETKWEKGERAHGSAARGPNAARLSPKTAKLKPGRDRVQAFRSGGRKPDGDRTGLRVLESDANCIAGCL